MPERIMPNLPADPHHPHRAPSVYSSLKQNGAYPPDLYRGAPPPQRQHQPGHLAPGEFARSQSAFGSHPGPPPPPRRKSRLLRVVQRAADAVASSFSAAPRCLHATSLAVPLRSDE
ncbi:hypothetical protein M422DRAFT_276392 [Sphaerobolus stellatus SS14]|uniref:Uncharacterized protein n=1 Tax=Sphaerobolus stellatus (strain SS14) TaxID=990650 RepID=A0A0C9U217_SPHS4|nr:hypothetical protein M422DRAFT_276392 [Sphaerobolus stellatus SS14]